MEYKISKGTVTIDGQVYKAFEMFANGPWKIVKGERSDCEVVAIRIPAKSGKQALERWLSPETTMQ